MRKDSLALRINISPPIAKNPPDRRSPVKILKDRSYFSEKNITGTTGFSFAWLYISS